MSFRFHPPSNEDDFADFCVRLLSKVFECGSFQKYGKRGESQDGIDIIDFAHGTPFRAAQCKHHEVTKTCPPEEIREEVAKAAKSEFEIDEFYIMTSGRKTSFAEKEVIKINGKRPYGQKFVTIIWTWLDIETKLSELDPIAQDYVLNSGSSNSRENFRAILGELLLETAPNTLNSSNSILQFRLQSVETHLKNFDRKLAKYELDQIELMPDAKQTAADRYLIHRLHAKYLMIVGEYDEAAKRFIDAYNENPNIDQAKSNRAVALELQGNKEGAWKQASELMQAGIRTEPLPSIVYRTAPRPHSQEVTNWLADLFATSEDLNIVVADEARNEKRFDDSIAACDLAQKINPKSARSHLLRGLAYHNLGISGEIALRRRRLEQAEIEYTCAKSIEVESLPDTLLPDIYRNLANVQYLLGNGESRSTFEEAIERAKDKSPYVEQYVGFLCANSDFETASNIIDKYGLDPVNLDHQFLQLVVQRSLASNDDRKSYIGKMLQLYSNEDFSRRDECLGFAVQWSIDDLHTTEAIESIRKFEKSSVPFDYHVCLAWLYHVDKKPAEALATAITARDLCSLASERNYVFLLARLFVELKRDADALPLFQRSADYSRLSDETRSLLDCAQRLRSHSVMLEVCRSLRLNKADTRQTLSVELQLLYGYQPTEGAKLLHELVQSNPKDQWLYAWWCHVETRLNGRVDGLEFDRLPSAADTSVVESERVIGPLIANENFAEAIRFAYDLLRFNPGDEIAHGRYLWIFMQYAGRCGIDFSAAKVGLGTVVSYSENDESVKFSIIDSDSPCGRFDGEISIDSDLGQVLMNHCAGDAVTLSSEAIQPRLIKIESVVNKYVYRYQQVMQNFQLNFPHANTIQMFQIMDGDELNLSPIQQSLEKRREECDRIFEQFRNSQLPIQALAFWLGIGYYDAHDVLTTKPEIGIRCGTGDESKANDIKKQLQKIKQFILDHSAIVAIEKLNLWPKLSTYSLFICRLVLEQFESEEEKARDDSSKGTFVLNEEGRLVLRPTSSEEKSERTRIASSIVSHIKLHCEICESSESAAVAPDLRTAFSNIGGFPLLDTIAFASKKPDALLWSDEVFVQLVSQVDFKVSVVGTQAIIEHLRSKGTLSWIDSDEHNAKLLGWNFTPILWNADIALAAARIASWDPTSWPFNAVVELFKKKHWTLRQKCDLALALFTRLFPSKAGHFDETRLVLAVMNAIGERKAATLIRSQAPMACVTNREMLYSIQCSVDVWEERYLGR